MWFIWLSIVLLQQCIYVVHPAKCCIIAAVYVCMYVYVYGGSSGYVLHYCGCVCMYVCMWFIWLSVALLQQCMYVVHLAKCCIIATVYVCMYVCVWSSG